MDDVLLALLDMELRPSIESLSRLISGKSGTESTDKLFEVSMSTLKSIMDPKTIEENRLNRSNGQIVELDSDRVYGLRDDIDKLLVILDNKIPNNDNEENIYNWIKETLKKTLGRVENTSVELDEGDYTGAYHFFSGGGYCQGHGIMKYKNDDSYEGDWNNGVRQGHGTMKYNNGSVYEGAWNNGVREGHGTLKYRDGGVYEGDWNNDLHHGYVIRKYRSGAFYQDLWKKGEMSGKGIIKITYSDRNTYEGAWNDGKPHGYGIMKYNIGDLYVGDWKNGLRQGQGVMKWNNGNTGMMVVSSARTPCS